MIKRLLLALGMIAALAACNTPAATSTPGTNTGSSPAPSVVAPSDSGLESMEPSTSPS